MIIERHISNYLPAATTVPKQGTYFDTAARLRGCAENGNWATEDFQTMEFLSKRVEISGRIHESYHETGGRTSEAHVSQELLPVALLLLLKDCRRLSNDGRPTDAAKRLNALLKLLDYLDREKVSLDEKLAVFINTEAEHLLENFPRADNLSCDAPPEETKGSTTDTLPLTVLFWEGPIARAYLATLKNMGLNIDKIIHLVSKNDLSSKKPVGRFLPGAVRLVYAQSRQKNSIHHWSKVLQRTETALYQGIRDVVERGLDFSQSVIDDALALNDLNEYSSDVETLMISDLKDEALYDRLSRLPALTQILFTGGGIIPKSLLQLDALKFIHVHPGYLPDIRGADCALWSHLIKGRTSATCFYMAPGIDDGDVIFASYLPPLHFPTSIAGTHLKTLYRATYAFFDPWIRACILRRAVLLTQGFTCVEARPQTEQDSVTYHFMHEQIQRVAFSRLFSGTVNVVVN